MTQKQPSKPSRLRIKKPVQERSKQTRRRILDASKDLFAEIGFDSANTNLIAARAGVSIGSVYAHFKDKWEIFLTILDEFSEDMFVFIKSGVDRILASEMDPEEVIDWLIPGLYRAHRLNGNLNLEMDKFALKDERAGNLRAQWETRMNEEILRLLRAFQDKITVEDLEAAVIVVHRSAHEVFQYLHRNRDAVDEQSILSEFATMLKRYAVASITWARSKSEVSERSEDKS